MKKRKYVTILLFFWLLSACTPKAVRLQPVIPTASEPATSSNLGNSPALSAESLSEILWASDPSIPQYNPGSAAFADFPKVVKQLSDMGSGSIDAADDLAVAIRYPRQDAYLAAQALLKLGPEITATTIPLLIDNLGDEKPETRIYSLILLASVGKRAACAVGEVAPLLWDADPLVRSAATTTLKEITEQDLIASEYEISIRPSFSANSIPADVPEGKVVDPARRWWDEQGSQVNWHPGYGICDP